MEEPIIIPIDTQLEEFAEHVRHNERIIFSAKFGDGKTYFLNEFKKEYDNNYLFITIYPVNYQVEDNKDIFELIKRDILFQLCEYGIVTDKIDTDALCKSVFNKETVGELIDFLGNIAGIGIPGAAIVGTLAKKFLSSKENYDSNKNTINKHFEKHQNMPGIYEFDCYSRLITDSIDGYKKEHNGKKIILIIEDLDRLDPAHVFRILNIFSAHIDRSYIDSSNNFNNKFGFDKVITVCHFESLKRIFVHFYGEGANFKGYIGKFSPLPPFCYSLKALAVSHFESEVKKMCLLDFAHINHEPYNAQIREMSIRDMLSILEKINTKIRNVHIRNNQIRQLKTESKGHFTSFLSLSKIMDINSRDIINNILYKQNESLIRDLFNSIGKHWALSTIVDWDRKYINLPGKAGKAGVEENHISIKLHINAKNTIDLFELTGSIDIKKLDIDKISNSIIKIISNLEKYILQ